MIEDVGVGPVGFQVLGNFLQHALGLGGLVGSNGASQNRLLPHILAVRFCHGDIELAM